MNPQFGNSLIEAESHLATPLPVETTLPRFLREGLPSLLPNRPVMASAVSYRGIAGCERGELTRRQAPVRVLAFPGDHRVNLGFAIGVRLQRLSGLPIAREQVAAILASEVARASEEAAGSMRAAEILLREAKESPLVVAYAGFHGFSGCIESATRLTRARPDALITFVTCTCCLEAKRAQLAPLVESGALRSLVVIDRCGGEEEMGEIVSTLLKLS